MSRLTRTDKLMGFARLAAQMSTCNRLNVGAIIAMDGRTISEGYNGPPKGLPHCRHKPRSTEPCTRAIHAETNAIIFAGRKGVAVEGGSLFVTHMPCLACAGNVVQAGLVSVTYDKPYRDDSGVLLLRDAGVSCLTYRERLEDEQRP